MMPIKVLVVAGAVSTRKIITDLVNVEPELDVVGTASNGRLALARIEQLEPDIITLDVDMPEMGGLETLSVLRERNIQLPVIVFSDLSTRGSSVAIDALARGAIDCVARPTSTTDDDATKAVVAHELVPRLKRFGAAFIPEEFTGDSEDVPLAVAHDGVVRAVMVGASTGGPVALEHVIRAIHTALPVPIFVAQHMPNQFTASISRRLDALGASRVIEGEDGMLVEAGTVYIAPGGKHMVVNPSAAGHKIRLHEGPPVNSCRPSVDVLFESAVTSYGGEQLAVILTGMGNDGLAGAKEIAAAGGDIYAQDEATSVVWGMPRAVTKAGVACRVFPLDAIGAAIVQRVSSSFRAPTTAGKGQS